MSKSRVRTVSAALRYCASAAAFVVVVSVVATNEMKIPVVEHSDAEVDAAMAWNVHELDVNNDGAIDYVDLKAYLSADSGDIEGVIALLGAWGVLSDLRDDHKDGSRSLLWTYKDDTSIAGNTQQDRQLDGAAPPDDCEWEFAGAKSNTYVACVWSGTMYQECDDGSLVLCQVYTCHLETDHFVREECVTDNGTFFRWRYWGTTVDSAAWNESDCPDCECDDTESEVDRGSISGDTTTCADVADHLSESFADTSLLSWTANRFAYVDETTDMVTQPEVNMRDEGGAENAGFRPSGFAHPCKIRVRRRDLIETSHGCYRVIIYGCDANVWRIDLVPIDCPEDSLKTVAIN